MKHILRSSLFCLFVFSMIAFSQGTEEPWALLWPLFKNAPSPHGVLSGYGDWCVIDEGPHPGLDFAGLLNDSVVIPTDQVMFSLGAKDFGASNGGCAMAIGSSAEGVLPYWGWGLLHLEIHDPSVEPFVFESDLSGREALAPCFQYIWPGGIPAPLHLHLAWVKCDDIDPDPLIDEIVPIAPFYGYYNPFDYFSSDLSTYDEVQFKQVLYEGYKNTGAWFMPDGVETAAQIAVLTDYSLFQEVISGAVDIAVSPFSAFQGLSDRDSAGVYSVSYEILRQNPHSLEYEPAAPEAGNFGERYLMEMRDVLLYGDSDEYRAIFLDGNLVSGVTEDNCDPGENSYIITNSGAVDPSAWETGWNNVYTASGYMNSWADGICQGAWDTMLARSDLSSPPVSNREAFFPDGRYAVEVSAVSHGSRDEGSMILPVDDLSLANPEIEGIVVDNFFPSVGAVFIYTTNFSEDKSAVDLKFLAKWFENNDLDSPEYFEQRAYLDELKEDLQMLEQHAEMSTLRSTRLAGDILPIEAGNSIAQIEHNESGRVIGRDPIEFLREEIAKIEEELDFIPDSREYLDYGFGYIPYAGSGETLNMLVLYSEPTMTETETGLPVTDFVWLCGYINEEILWDSKEHGTFVRDSPIGNSAHATLLQEQYSIYFPEYPNADYAVHYTFSGELPEELCGTIQAFIGTNIRSQENGPRDLAGHLMDCDPSTIPAVRGGYESWEGIQPGTYPGYEAVSDGYYNWGIPNWSRSGNTVSANVGADIVAEVILSNIGLEDALFYGNCYPWYGFWMYEAEEGECGFNIPVVKYNGARINHYFSTKYPFGTYPGQYHFNGQAKISWDRRYFWLSGVSAVFTEYPNYATLKSDAFVYCIDSQTGARINRWMASAFCSTGSSSDHIGPSSANATVMQVYKDGQALIRVSDPDEADVLGVYYTILDPPGSTSDCIDERSRESDVSSVVCEIFTEIVSNPVQESLEFIVTGVEETNWSICVYDLSGRRVFEDNGFSNNDTMKFQINTQDFPVGLYVLNLQVGDRDTKQTFSVLR